MNFRIRNGSVETFGAGSEIPIAPGSAVLRCFLTNDSVLTEAAAAEIKIQRVNQPLELVGRLQSLGFELIGALETAESVYIFNDWFGRVPLYVWRLGSQMVLGDTLLEFSTLIGRPIEFDSVALRQYLWCSYPLGDRSLYKDISVAPPGSVFKISRNSGAIEHLRNSSLADFRFDQFASAYSLDDMRGLFYDSFKGRFAKYPNIILSLSGGQDSRAALAALENLRLSYYSSTFYFPARAKNPDHDTAKLLAAETSHPENWLPIPISESEAQEEELLRLKCGMNYLGVNHMIGFFSELRKRFNPDAIYLTGDGGDKVFPDLRDGATSSFDALLQTTLKRHALIPITQSEEWVPATISVADSVAEVLKSYPEEDNRARSKAFVLRERARKSFYEGEDRNRKFFVSSTPFYNTSFFQYLMRIPDDDKTGPDLYQKFQKLLSAKFASIPDALGYPADSWRYALRQRAQGTLRSLPTDYKNRLRKIVGMGASLPIPKRELLGQLLEKTDAAKYLNVQKVREAIPSLNTIQYQYLRTILRLLELKIVQ